MITGSSSFEKRSATDKDEEIKRAIQKVLLFHNFDRKSDIEIKTVKGWVSLEGYVFEPWLRDKAAELAQNIHGVNVIINKLAIVPSGDETDFQIAQHIIDNFDDNININVERITVTVDGKIVILEGNVTNWQTKEAALKIARSTANVKSVNEKIKVLQ